MSKVFPYPLPETKGIGDVDPLDYRHKDGEVVIEPEWWRNVRLPEKKTKKRRRR